MKRNTGDRRTTTTCRCDYTTTNFDVTTASAAPATTMAELLQPRGSSQLMQPFKPQRRLQESQVLGLKEVLQASIFKYCNYCNFGNHCNVCAAIISVAATTTTATTCCCHHNSFCDDCNYIATAATITTATTFALISVDSNHCKVSRNYCCHCCSPTFATTATIKMSASTATR